MSQKIIDANLFADGTEPWPNQVFQQDFDAYFWLSYPPFEYSATEVFNPFSFMNNLDERTIYIQTPNGSKHFNLNMPPGVYDFENFYEKFKVNFGNERFLLWQGEKEQWAIISDKKNKICVLAMQWQIVGQVDVFFKQSKLSPKAVLEILNLQKHEAIFIKNYAPSACLTEGNNENKVWRKYYFQCHVNNENDKLFYWSQFKKLFECSNKLLKPFKGIDLYACQAFDRRYWRNKQWYSSGSFAPVGGYQKYSIENFEKVATKFLPNNEHLVLKFEGKTTEAEALYIANKKGLIEFYDFQIYAHSIKQKQRGSAFEFMFKMGLYDHSNKATLHNQNFQFFYQENLLKDEDVNIFIEELKTFCHIIKIHEVRQPNTYAEYTFDKPLEIHGIYGFVPEAVMVAHPFYGGA
jgi:hypothetical protein